MTFKEVEERAQTVRALQSNRPMSITYFNEWCVPARVLYAEVLEEIRDNTTDERARALAATALTA